MSRHRWLVPPDEIGRPSGDRVARRASWVPDISVRWALGGVLAVGALAATICFEVVDTVPWWLWAIVGLAVLAYAEGLFQHVVGDGSLVAGLVAVAFGLLMFGPMVYGFGSAITGWDPIGWNDDGGSASVDDGSGDESCDPNYSGCVPAGVGDVDCTELDQTDIEVIGDDVYGLDGNDNDGIACESY